MAKKKYTLEEFKELFDVASEAVKKDVTNKFTEAKELADIDETVANMTNRLIKAETYFIMKRLNKYMFSSLDEESEEE